MFVVCPFCVRRVDDLPSIPTHSEGKIIIFPVHEEVLAKSADAVKCFAPDKHRCTTSVLALDWLLEGEILPLCLPVVYVAPSHDSGSSYLSRVINYTFWIPQKVG